MPPSLPPLPPPASPPLSPPPVSPTPPLAPPPVSPAPAGFTRVVLIFELDLEDLSDDELTAIVVSELGAASGITEDEALQSIVVISITVGSVSFEIFLRSYLFYTPDSLLGALIHGELPANSTLVNSSSFTLLPALVPQPEFAIPLLPPPSLPPSSPPPPPPPSTSFPPFPSTPDQEPPNPTPTVPPSIPPVPPPALPPWRPRPLELQEIQRPPPLELLALVLLLPLALLPVLLLWVRCKYPGKVRLWFQYRTRHTNPMVQLGYMPKEKHDELGRYLFSTKQTGDGPIEEFTTWGAEDSSEEYAAPFGRESLRVSAGRTSGTGGAQPLQGGSSSSSPTLAIASTQPAAHLTVHSKTLVVQRVGFSQGRLLINKRTGASRNSTPARAGVPVSEHV